MLTRREFVGYGSIGATSSLLGASRQGVAQTGRVSTLLDAQKQLDLEITIGTLVGASLGALIYIGYARLAPAHLIASFAEGLVNHAGRPAVGSLSRPTRNYIDYRMTRSQGNAIVALNMLQKDIASDARAFRQLSVAVVQQTNLLAELRNETGRALQEIREGLNLVRGEMDTVRLERARAARSSAVYSVTQDELHATRVDREGHSKGTIEIATKEATNLDLHCRHLEDVILRTK